MSSELSPADRIHAAFFWLSLEMAAGRKVDLAAHLEFAEWTLRDVRAQISA